MYRRHVEVPPQVRVGGGDFVYLRPRRTREQRPPTRSSRVPAAHQPQSAKRCQSQRPNTYNCRHDSAHRRPPGDAHSTARIAKRFWPFILTLVVLKSVSLSHPFRSRLLFAKPPASPPIGHTCGACNLFLYQGQRLDRQQANRVGAMPNDIVADAELALTSTCIVF
jgi:hypothetical protein